MWVAYDNIVVLLFTSWLLYIYYVIAPCTATKRLSTLSGKQLNRYELCILHAAHFCRELSSVSSRLLALEQQVESV